jgi:6-phosphofructokinase 1
VVLGHLQRGGSPTTFDRLLALRFGAAAVRAVEAREFGRMVALDPPKVVTVPLVEALSGWSGVPLDHDSVLTAREVGISLGD